MKPRINKSFAFRSCLIITSFYIIIYLFDLTRDSSKVMLERIRNEISFTESVGKEIGKDTTLNKFVQIKGRADCVKKNCAKTDKRDMTLENKKKELMENLKQVIIFPEEKISWCLVPKVASTSISEAFLSISKRENLPIVTEPKHNYSQYYLRKAYPPVTWEVFRELEPSLLSFLIVRHPFERLVSAFESKLINIDNNHDREYFSRFVDKIVTHYRKNDTKIMREIEFQKNSTFSMTNTSKFEEPTFDEFVDYLLDLSVDEYDEHWKPVTYLCHICTYNYDFIIKYEYFQQEFQALIEHFKGIGRLNQEFKIGWVNKAKISFKNKDRIEKYFTALSADKIQSLYNIYKTDFLYFNYDLDM